MSRIKVFFSILLISALIISAAAISADAEGGYLRGDADGDGKITILDATAIQRKLANLSNASFNEKAADVDGSGLDITDATMIQRYLVNLEDPYHINEYVSDESQSEFDEYELPFVPK